MNHNFARLVVPFSFNRPLRLSSFQKTAGKSSDYCQLNTSFKHSITALVSLKGTDSRASMDLLKRFSMIREQRQKYITVPFHTDKQSHCQCQTSLQCPVH